ncbi:MAG TPA: TIGR03009 domain-containing protein [Fimbriiglobus sp.]|jgi:TIGR03009 family protein
MRTFGVALGLLVVAGSVASAQIPGGAPPTGSTTGRVPTPGAGPGRTVALQPPAVPVDPMVLAHLKAWQAKMESLQNLYTTCELTKEDRVLKKSHKFSGSVICMKPNLARMRLDSATDPNDYSAWVCDGKAVYAYDGNKKILTQYNIPAGTNGIGDNLLMEFMSGSLTANGALRRFDVTLISPEKPDPNYLFFQIKPKLAKDKQDFETLKLVLFSPTIKPDLQYLAYIPAMVQMATTNNEKVETWNFFDPAKSRFPQPNVKGLKLSDFKPVNPGRDWKIVQGNPPASGGSQPRVVRPTGPGK